MSNDKIDEEQQAEEQQAEEQPCGDGRHDPAMAAKQVIHALTSRDAQRHFIHAGVELAMGIEAIMRSLPVPEPVEKMKDASSDYMKFVIEEAFCANNPYCKHRDEGGVKKVELD